MVIKTNKKSSTGKIIYNSNKTIVTAEDKSRADKEYSDLEKMITKVEKILSNRGLLDENAKKTDALVVWHTIGQELDKYLGERKVSFDDENVFWETLYSQWPKVRAGLSKINVNSAKNDFKIATELARFNVDELAEVGSWGLWREIVSYKRINNDRRIINWIICELKKRPRSRDFSRPLLKAIFNRFKNIDTRILTEKELYDKLSEIQI